jgi:hypothetical protein
MKIQFIYTYEKRQQEYGTFDFDLSVLKTNEKFKDFATSFLNDDEIKDLIKISSCVITDENINLPNWYIKSNGKIFF